MKDLGHVRLALAFGDRSSRLPSQHLSYHSNNEDTMDVASRDAEGRESASPADQNTSTRCLLLELPTELRLPIYEHLLKPSTVQVISPCNQDVTGMTSDAFATTCCFARAVGKQLYPAVLRLCRQVYNESHPFLLKPDRLLLQPSVARWMDLSAHRAIDVRRFTGLRDIDHIEVELDTLASSIAEDTAHSTLLASVLRSDSYVQKLTLGIIEYSEESSDDGLADVEDWQRLIKIWSYLRPSFSFFFLLCDFNKDRDYTDPAAEALGCWQWHEVDEIYQWAVDTPRDCAC